MHALRSVRLAGYEGDGQMLGSADQVILIPSMGEPPFFADGFFLLPNQQAPTWGRESHGFHLAAAVQPTSKHQLRQGVAPLQVLGPKVDLQSHALWQAAVLKQGGCSESMSSEASKTQTMSIQFWMALVVQNLHHVRTLQRLWAVSFQRSTLVRSWA